MAEPEVARAGFLDMQVCVPRGYTNEQVIMFAEHEYPCGTEHGWHIREQGNKALGGCNERVQCHDHPENVHIVLDA